MAKFLFLSFSSSRLKMDSIFSLKFNFLAEDEREEQKKIIDETRGRFRFTMKTRKRCTRVYNFLKRKLLLKNNNTQRYGKFVIYLWPQFVGKTGREFFGFEII